MADKISERSYLELLQELQPALAGLHFKESESPDFVLLGRDQSIGIEVTRLFPASAMAAANLAAAVSADDDPPFDRRFQIELEDRKSVV